MHRPSAINGGNSTEKNTIKRGMPFLSTHRGGDTFAARGWLSQRYFLYSKIKRGRGFKWESDTRILLCYGILSGHHGVTLSTTSDVSNIFLIFHETTKMASDKNQPEQNINFMRLQDIQISFTSSDVLEILQEPIKALKIFPWFQEPPTVDGREWTGVNVSKYRPVSKVSKAAHWSHYSAQAFKSCPESHLRPVCLSDCDQLYRGLISRRPHTSRSPGSIPPSLEFIS